MSKDFKDIEDLGFHAEACDYSPWLRILPAGTDTAIGVIRSLQFAGGAPDEWEAVGQQVWPRPERSRGWTSAFDAARELIRKAAEIGLVVPEAAARYVIQTRHHGEWVTRMVIRDTDIDSRETPEQAVAWWLDTLRWGSPECAFRPVRLVGAEVEPVDEDELPARLRS